MSEESNGPSAIEEITGGQESQPVAQPPSVEEPAKVEPASQAGDEAPWWKSLSDPDLRGVAESRQWKDPEAVVASYRNLEKLRGVPEDKLLRLPDMDDEQAVSSVFERLGKPKSSTDYDFDLGDVTEQFKGIFHKANLTSTQAKIIANEYKSYDNQNLEQVQKQIQQESQAAINELKAEWGSTYRSRIEDVRRAQAKLGLSQDDLASMEASFGTRRFIEVLHKVGSQFSEALPPGELAGTGSHFGTSPDSARSEIGRLKNDKEFTAKLFAKDAKAVAEWDKLHRLAYPPQ